jgi:hypothetical protein
MSELKERVSIPARIWSVLRTAEPPQWNYLIGSFAAVSPREGEHTSKHVADETLSDCLSKISLSLVRNWRSRRR